MNLRKEGHRSHIKGMKRFFHSKGGRSMFEKFSRIQLERLRRDLKIREKDDPRRGELNESKD